jgi:hypothetical protein
MAPAFHDSGAVHALIEAPSLIEAQSLIEAPC